MRLIVNHWTLRIVQIKPHCRVGIHVLHFLPLRTKISLLCVHIIVINHRKLFRETSQSSTSNLLFTSFSPCFITVDGSIVIPLVYDVANHVSFSKQSHRNSTFPLLSDRSLIPQTGETWKPGAVGAAQKGRKDFANAPKASLVAENLSVEIGAELKVDEFVSDEVF